MKYETINCAGGTEGGSFVVVCGISGVNYIGKLVVEAARATVYS